MASFYLTVFAALCTLYVANGQFFLQQQQQQPAAVAAQRVRSPQLESAQVSSNRLGGNFAYSVAESGPVDTVVQHIFAQPQLVPTVHQVPSVRQVQLLQPTPQVQLLQPTPQVVSWQVLPQGVVFAHPGLATVPVGTAPAGTTALGTQQVAGR